MRGEEAMNNRGRDMRRTDAVQQGSQADLHGVVLQRALVHGQRHLEARASETDRVPET